ncbi:MAG: YifB family Mg chelatase-like AAA ATPase [Candidatus Omnitrophica bacterium]|nr:YifB family Mg chelatase-like AAA ATPase [Candidatus Omnitrophota bacterium]
MLAKVYSCGINGLEAYPVVIEVDAGRGLPATIIVGLPDNAVKESRERVRSAIKNSGYKFGPKRITINLSPADTRKEGPSFDLAIALGILAASEQIPFQGLDQYVILGELSLNGNIQPVKGALAIALSLPADQFKGLIVPRENASEAAIAGCLPVYPAENLRQVVHFLNNPESLSIVRQENAALAEDSSPPDLDFSDVKGHAFVKRGLEVAAAGGHNFLLIGPPGSGKSMLAKRFGTILPDMTTQEALETTKIHSVAGLLKTGTGLMIGRPFRAPHHTTSAPAIVGGGTHPKPGEVTLAHNGVLFLDELPEFNRDVLEAMRQPLEDHHVLISRANKTLRFPSRFLLACAMNPCCCGFLSDPRHTCTCSSHQVQKYLSRISGPLLDRIDLHLEVPALATMEIIVSGGSGEPSRAIKERAVRARAIQQKRFGENGVFANAYMNHRQIKQFCGLDDEGKKLIKMAVEELGLSARGYDKILKITRTIADLAGSQQVQAEHLAEAIQYRSLDRRNWCK